MKWLWPQLVLFAALLYAQGPLVAPSGHHFVATDVPHTFTANQNFAGGFQINGVTLSGTTGTGAAVLASGATLTNPTLAGGTLNSVSLVTPTLGVAAGTSLALGGGPALTTTARTGTGPLVLGTAPTITSLTVAGGIANSGTGVKHARVTGCTLTNPGALSVCDTTVTWAGTPFPDTLYTAVCIGETISSPAAIQGISNKFTDRITVRTYSLIAFTGTLGFGTINCAAWHDF